MLYRLTGRPFMWYQLSGDLALVKKALKAVSTRLYENPPRNRGEGNAMEVLYGGASLYPYLTQGGGSFLPHTPIAGSMMGFGAYPGYGTMWPSAPLPQFYGVGSAPIRASGAEGEGELVIRILCPNDKIGSMIGKGGSIIRKMREDTGAAIKVAEAIPNADERVIEIRSTEVWIDKGLFKLKISNNFDWAS